MRIPLCVGNWKMQGTIAEGRALAASIRDGLKRPRGVDVVICPPFTALAAVNEVLSGTPLRLGAQNCHWEAAGAHTGEISLPMLVEVGCRYVLVGHSERRVFLGETDRNVSHKVAAALRAGLHPVVCVGEDLEARTAGRQGQVVRDQVARSLDGVPRHEAARLAMAYEPIWAIGTGRAATPADAAEMHSLIRNELGAIFGESERSIRILYGGSVGEKNADDLMSRGEIDGLLVGGASLRPAEFGRIAGFRGL